MMLCRMQGRHRMLLAPRQGQTSAVHVTGYSYGQLHDMTTDAILFVKSRLEHPCSTQLYRHTCCHTVLLPPCPRPLALTDSIWSRTTWSMTALYSCCTARMAALLKEPMYHAVGGWDTCVGATAMSTATCTGLGSHALQACCSSTPLHGTALQGHALHYARMCLGRLAVTTTCGAHDGIDGSGALTGDAFDERGVRGAARVVVLLSQGRFGGAQAARKVPGVGAGLQHDEPGLHGGRRSAAASAAAVWEWGGRGGAATQGESRREGPSEWAAAHGTDR